VAGTPSAQRRIEADNKRVADLAQIARAIHSWHSQSLQPLPASLDDPVLARIAGPVLADPETGQPYQYRPLDDGRYQLCAVFDESSEPGSGQFVPFWRHPAGLTCFTLQPETGAPGS
jgi:hypothetical protein